MVGENIKLNENDIKYIVTEATKKIVEADRHRPDYYKDYAEKTGRKDRHSPDYYKKYREAKKQETLSQDDTGSEKLLKPQKKKGNKDRHKPGYYHNYNQEHLERLERGFTKGYLGGKVSNGPKPKLRGDMWYDELGRAHSYDFYNPTMTDLIDDRMSDWHDDDWCEEPF